MSGNIHTHADTRTQTHNISHWQLDAEVKLREDTINNYVTKLLLGKGQIPLKASPEHSYCKL